jgi:PAS domain S-box-containing protein
VDAAALIRKYGSTVLGAIGVALWIFALYLLSSAAQDSTLFNRWLPWILVVNIAGLLTLFALLAAKLFRLVREYRRHAPGSRLKARTVAIFSALAVAPILVVYYFSLQFINRGIDSWFQVEVSQGLKDTRELSRAALDVRVREFLQNTEAVARTLSSLPDFDLVGALDRARRETTAIEFTVLGAQTRILATSSDRPMDSVPLPATDEMMLQMRRGRPYVSLDTDAFGGYVIRAAAPLNGNGNPGGRVLIAMYPVPAQLSELADTVQRSYTQYANLVQLRQPLKSTFVLILSFVVLLSLLAAVYGAFFAAQRLVKPVQDLIAGTRAVARGDYDTQLPLPSRDELGFLVTSFNDMTKRLARARVETRRSQQAVEAERAGLAVILARLSTGVVSLEADMTVRTANQAASAILGVDLEGVVGKRFDESVSDGDLYQQFLAAVNARLLARNLDWREQIELLSDSGKRVLMCACTALPNDVGAAQGVVLVFDDITTLLQAQRDAAWGEVARRLAHEIKNPLTPIQLSAERMRRKFLGSMNAQDAQILERATHTIVAQVDAMKQIHAIRSEPTDHGSGRSLSGAGQRRERQAAAGAGFARDLGRSHADPPNLEQSRDQLFRGPGGQTGRRHRSRNTARRGRRQTGGFDPGHRQRAGVPARPDRYGVRSLRDQQAQGHGPRARDRQEDRRGARRAHRGRQSAHRRRQSQNSITPGRERALRRSPRTAQG